MRGEGLRVRDQGVGLRVQGFGVICYGVEHSKSRLRSCFTQQDERTTPIAILRHTHLCVPTRVSGDGTT